MMSNSPVMSNFAQILKDREPTLLDRRDGHWYKTKSDSVYPSISTILSATAPIEKKEGLASWKASEPAHKYITTQAQETGMQTHKIIEEYMRGRSSPDEFDLLPAAHFKNLQPLLDNISDVICVEQPMHSDELMVAGTVDLIARYRGELAVIDYKTKRKPQIDEYMSEYYLQTACYAHMFEESTGQKITQIVILVSSEKNTRQEFVKTCSDYILPMTERIERYHITH